MYKASIAIDDFTFSIMHNRVPFLRKFVIKRIFFWTPVSNVICMSLCSVFLMYNNFNQCMSI